jgi:hypothetical protein
VIEGRILGKFFARDVSGLRQEPRARSWKNRDPLGYTRGIPLGVNNT